MEVTGALVSLDIGVVALHGPVYSAPSALTAKWDGASVECAWERFRGGHFDSVT